MVKEDTRLKKLILERGFRLNAVAKAIDVDPYTMSRWKNTAPIDKLLLLSKFTSIPILELIDCFDPGLIVGSSLLAVKPHVQENLDMGEIKTLKEIISESGLTHQQLANMLGVKSPRISELMRPGQDLRMSTSIKLAKALKISLKTIAESIGQDTTGIPDD